METRNLESMLKKHFSSSHLAVQISRLWVVSYYSQLRYMFLALLASVRLTCKSFVWSNGATTLSTTTLRLMVLLATLSIYDFQHSKSQFWVPGCWVSHFIYCYAECRSVEFHHAEGGRHAQYHHDEWCHAECRYAECRYADCRYAECYHALCRYAECRSAGLTTQLISPPVNDREKCFIWSTPGNPFECSDYKELPSEKIQCKGIKLYCRYNRNALLGIHQVYYCRHTNITTIYNQHLI